MTFQSRIFHIFFQAMIRKQKLKMRLEKISESSSPSSSHKQREITTQRLNPLALTTITTKQARPRQKQKKSEVQTIQEKIMMKKQALTLWQEAKINRQNNDRPIDELLPAIIQDIRYLCSQDLLIKRTILNALQRGKKGILQWILALIREAFILILSVITQRRLKK